MPNTAYLSLGSNIEPETNIKAAVAILAQLTRLVAVSSVWETQPVGLLNQPNFLNAAVIVHTPLSAAQLKQQVLSHIEQTLGRTRQANKNGPRTIDIDIMLFNDQILTIGSRSIPDIEVLERPFVAIPLAELAPDYIHPQTGQPLQEIAGDFAADRQNMRLCPEFTQVLKQLVIE
jgi:2-amino-4-hydroxy-6-hydroxymethyldihydropteridine diphosphokinase